MDVELATSETAGEKRDRIFTLQVNDLLKVPTYNEKARAAIGSFLQRLRKCLASCKKQSVKIRKGQAFLGRKLEWYRKKERFDFQFSKPTTVDIVGSYLTNTSLQLKADVDVVLTLPEETVASGDTKDWRLRNFYYLNKRRIYLHYIAKRIEKKLKCSVSVSLYQDDTWKPILTVYPPGLDSCPVRLLTALPRTYHNTKTNRQLLPHRNNVRTKEADDVATPYYNQTIAEELYYRTHFDKILSLTKGKDNLIKAICLLKRWVRTRCADNARFSINAFHITMFTVYLMEEGCVNEHMTTVAIFRVVLEALLFEKYDMTKGIFFNGEDEESITSHRKFFPVVFVCNGINLTFRVQESHYSELLRQAKRDLHLMKNKHRRDAFHLLFHKMVRWDSRFDCWLFLDSNECKTDHPGKEAISSTARRIEQVLKEAYTDRITNLSIFELDDPSRRKSPLTAKIHRPKKLVIGIRYKGLNWLRQNDVGPPSGKNDLARAFIKFWGVSCIRRMPDGTLAENVRWKPEVTDVLLRIARHVLKRHLDISPNSLSIVSDLFYHNLPEQPQKSAELAFKTLKEHLLAMRDVPVKINNVFGTHSAFCSTTAIFPSCTSDTDLGPCGYKALPIVIEFELNAKWPDDTTAMERIQTAFYIKMAQSLTIRFKHVATPARDWLDVIVHGFAFRVMIHHPRRLAYLLEDDPVRAEELYRELKHKPRMVTMLSSISQRLPYYATTCRLAKRWLSAHLFSGVINEVAVDLMVLHCFFEPYPYDVPTSSTQGFLRFLQLLASFSWHANPLVVDVWRDLTTEDYEKCEKAFEDSRTSIDGSRAVFIATRYDLRSDHWTKNQPDRNQLARLQKCAAASYRHASTCIRNESASRQCLRPLFKPVVSRYCASLKLEQRLILDREHYIGLSTSGRANVLTQRTKRARKRLFAATSEKPKVGFNIFSNFIRDLRTQFGKIAEFARDNLGGNRIYVRWKKKVEDQENMLWDMAVCGEGLVTGVELANTSIKRRRLNS